jgi:hypothetical protein
LVLRATTRGFTVIESEMPGDPFTDVELNMIMMDELFGAERRTVHIELQENTIITPEQVNHMLNNLWGGDWHV